MSRTVAENIIALIITPLQSDELGGINNDLAPNYFYDSRAYQHISSPLAEATRHRLPPLIRITLVALDNVSAETLEIENGSSMPDLGLDSYFATASSYESDIAALEKALTDKKLRYRVFSSTIRLRNAKWTSSN